MIRITSFHLQWNSRVVDSPYFLNPVEPAKEFTRLNIYFRTDGSGAPSGQLDMVLTDEEDATLRELLRKIVAVNFTTDAVLP